MRQQKEFLNRTTFTPSLKAQSLATKFEKIMGIPFPKLQKILLFSKCKPKNTAFLLLIELEILRVSW